MPKKIKILKNQSLLDIAIQTTGTLESLVELALFNNISITEELVPGSELLIPDELTIQLDVMTYYDKKQLKPTTSELTVFNFLLQEDGFGLLLEDGQNILL